MNLQLGVEVRKQAACCVWKRPCVFFEEEKESNFVNNITNYTFHENSTEVRSWKTSRLLCQSSSEGDLVSIEEEEERNFVKNVIKKLPVIKYFIGLKKENGKWKWLSNQTTVDSSQGKSPWAEGQPSQPKQEVNCAAIYGKYRSYLGRFDDSECSRPMKIAGHICEKVVSCTKHERGTSLFVEESVLMTKNTHFMCFIFVNQLLIIVWSITKEEEPIPFCLSLIHIWRCRRS